VQEGSDTVIDAISTKKTNGKAENTYREDMQECKSARGCKSVQEDARGHKSV